MSSNVRCDMLNCFYNIRGEYVGHCDAHTITLDKNKTCITYKRKGAHGSKKLTDYELKPEVEVKEHV